MATIYEAAGEAFDWFETAQRDDGETFTRHKDGAPEWVRDLTMSAHGDFFPDDWRYDCIRSVLGWIHDNEPEEFEDSRRRGRALPRHARDDPDVAGRAAFGRPVRVRRSTHCHERRAAMQFTIHVGRPSVEQGERAVVITSPGRVHGTLRFDPDEWEAFEDVLMTSQVKDVSPHVLYWRH